MKVTIRLNKNEYPKTYFKFILINLQYINTYQVYHFSFTFCNVFVKIIKIKK